MNGKNACVCHQFITDCDNYAADGLERTLDVDHKWKQIVAEASRQAKYCMTADDVSLMEQSHNSRPTRSMLLKFGERGMVVQELICLLTVLRLEKALNYFYKCANDVLIVEEHPPEVVVAERGKPLRLRCRAAGSAPVKYQWFYRANKMEGEDQPEFNVQSVRMEHYGKYKCRIHRRCPCGTLVQIYTNSCQVKEYEAPKVTPVPTFSETVLVRKQSFPSDESLFCTKYKASDKVALLIGNSNYRTAYPLPAVKNDLVAFKKKLTELNFRVFSFIDLALDEMLNALQTFSLMLREGVYGVFYFAGHGFECGGESYMMPIDCKTGTSDPNECLQVGDLLTRMQDRSPSLCALFLDMCRLMSVPPARCSQCGREEIPEAGRNFVGRGANRPPYCSHCQHPLIYNMANFGRWMPMSRDLVVNKAVFYATSSGEVAWEKEDGTQGVFMKSLIKCLESPKTMAQLYDGLGEEFLKNGSGTFQRPEVEMRTPEGRTLHDENEYYQHTAEFKFEHFYHTNHGVPAGQTVHYPNGVVFTVDFAEMLSNVLLIEVVLQTLPYGIQIKDLQLKFPQELSILPERFVSQQNELSKKPLFQQETDSKVFKLSEIQKLQRDLYLHMKLFYRDHQGKPRCDTITIDLGRPLVSEIWRKLFFDKANYMH